MEEKLMHDMLYLLAGVVMFALLWALAKACDKL